MVPDPAAAAPGGGIAERDSLECGWSVISSSSIISIFIEKVLTVSLFFVVTIVGVPWRWFIAATTDPSSVWVERSVPFCTQQQQQLHSTLPVWWSCCCFTQTDRRPGGRRNGAPHRLASQQGHCRCVGARGPAPARVVEQNSRLAPKALVAALQKVRCQAPAKVEKKILERSNCSD